MPFPLLSRGEKDNSDVKKHILSFVNHTLPMFTMSRVSKEANKLSKMMLNEMPREFRNTTNAKNFWLKTKNETLKFYMRSPTFLNRLIEHVDPKAKDEFICKSILSLSTDIEETFQQIKDKDKADLLKELITSGISFGHPPSKFFTPVWRCNSWTYSCGNLDSIRNKVKALSLGISCAEFEGLSDIQIKALSLGLPRKDIINIADEILFKQLNFWKDNIEEYAELLIGSRSVIDNPAPRRP